MYVGADILKYLMPSKIERDLKQLHKDTVESDAVNACKTVVLCFATLNSNMVVVVF